MPASWGLARLDEAKRLMPSNLRRNNLQLRRDSNARNHKFQRPCSYRCSHCPCIIALFTASPSSHGTTTTDRYSCAVDDIHSAVVMRCYAQRQHPPVAGIPDLLE